MTDVVLESQPDMDPLELSAAAQRRASHWCFGVRSHRFFAVVVSGVAVFVDNVFYAIVLPLLPVYESQLSLTRVDVGLLVASYSGTQILFTPLAGFLTDRYGPRRLLFAGLASMLVATLVYCFSTVYWLMLVARGLQGLCGTVTWTAALAMIPLALEPSEQGRAFGIVTMCGGLGAVSGPSLAGALYEAGGVQLPFFVMIGLIVLDLIFRLLLIDSVRSVHATAPQKSFVAGYRELLGTGAILLLLFATLIGSFVQVATEPIFPLLIAHRFDYEPLGVGLVMSALSVAYLVASLVVGWLCDRYRHRRRDFLALGFALGALCFAAIGFVESIYLFVPIMCAIGVAITFAVTPNMAEVNEVLERRRSKLFASAGALQNSVWALGSFVGPLVTAALAESSGESVAMLVLAALVLTSGAIFLFFSRAPYWNRKLFPETVGSAPLVDADGTELLLHDDDVSDERRSDDGGGATGGNQSE